MDSRDQRERGLDPRQVQTRSDLVRYLSQSLTGEYRTVVGDDEVRSTSTLVKTYLVEIHREASDPLRAWHTLEFLRVQPLEDRTLLRVVDGKGTFYFVDAINPRFQKVHTIDRVEQTDAVIDRITNGDSLNFDHAWLPSRLLKIQNSGRLTGFSFRFVDAMPGVLADSIEVDQATGEILSDVPRSRTFLKVSEDARAEREFHNLLNSEAFKGRKALDQIEFRSTDIDRQGDYTHSTIYGWGKVVTRGNWIGGHFKTIDRLTDDYERVIDKIESDFALGWVPRGRGYVHSGRPFEFIFPEQHEIEDLEAFVKLLFHTTKPFRLFGIPRRESSSRIDVAGVDLHSGDPVSFEITNSWLRVYLPKGSCGNIIPRLYANFQKHINSDIVLAADPERDPFDLEGQWSLTA